MKKIILILSLIILLLITSFANAGILSIKNIKLNLPPQSPTISGPSLSKVGYLCNFSVSTIDPDGDKIKYQLGWESDDAQVYSSWTEFFTTGHTAGISHAFWNPGSYIVRARAQDESGELSSWSDGLTIEINYLNQRRNIMITGFWVPTSQMVARFSTNPYVNPDGWQGENWENLGYDIYSFVAKQYYDNQGTWEWSYQQIWSEFWNISCQLKPIAIISFGQGGKENTWRIENKAVNCNKWYLDDCGNQPTPNPPDDTVCPGYIRLSSLPLLEIEKAVNNQTNINAEVNLVGTPGFYFCGYLAYLDVWYKALHDDPDDEFLCKSAGFIHVNGSIDLQECIEATNITIRKTAEKVTKNVCGIESVKLLPRLITLNQNYFSHALK